MTNFERFLISSDAVDTFKYFERLIKLWSISFASIKEIHLYEESLFIESFLNFSKPFHTTFSSKCGWDTKLMNLHYETLYTQQNKKIIFLSGNPT